MQTIDFELDRDHGELNQLLKLVGVADSGGQGKAIVASGDVTVDGAVELRKQQTMADRDLSAAGVTFRATGMDTQQAFPMDMVPRIITAREWDHLTAGDRRGVARLLQPRAQSDARAVAV